MAALRARKDAAWDGRLTYPITCQVCGHFALVKLTEQEREEVWRLRCSMCA